jgi:hypothetical protein
LFSWIAANIMFVAAAITPKTDPRRAEIDGEGRDMNG